MNKNKALLLVDIQNDFLPTGNLPVESGNEVIKVANLIMDLFPVVIASKDYHPSNHKSFASNHPNKKVGDTINLNGLQQILWPDHCIQGEEGSNFPKELNRNLINFTVTKGQDIEVDSYSAFYDNGRRNRTELTQHLDRLVISDLCIMGLATDYCVKYTVLDAIKEGFNVYLIEDGCRGVNLNPGDVEKAIQEMKLAGAKIINSKDIR